MPENLAVYIGEMTSLRMLSAESAVSRRRKEPLRGKLGHSTSLFKAIGISLAPEENREKFVRRRPSQSRLLDRPHRIIAARRRPFRGSTLRQRHDVLLKELHLAEQVQRSMLPRVLPKLPKVEVGASLRPSKHLAGDFYNVIRLDHDRVGVCLGDVMGHGPAAALLGVFAMQGLRTKTIEGSSYEVLAPAEVLASLSRDLIRADFYESPFVTMIYGVIDTNRNVFTYCCGGHPPALLLREGQPHRQLEGRSSLLGVFDLVFEEDQVELATGDRVAMYSDGADSIIWGSYGPGFEGLASLLSVRDGRSPQELIDAAMNVAEPGNGPSDDLTVVMFEMRR